MPFNPCVLQQLEEVESKNLPDAACVFEETDQLHEISAVFITQGVYINVEVFVLVEGIHCVDNAVGLLVSNLFIAPTKGTHKHEQGSRINLVECGLLLARSALWLMCPERSR